VASATGTSQLQNVRNHMLQRASGWWPGNWAGPKFGCGERFVAGYAVENGDMFV
jgi:hypothetical protein